MKTKNYLALMLALAALLLLAAACGEKRALVDVETVIVDGKRNVLWEGRTYAPFCVVSKKDCGEQIGYLNGDKDDRISAYKDYPPEEWLVSWMPMDGGAMLLKEQSVTEIPDGLQAEY